MGPEQELPLLEPRDRAELRAWLERNHATSGPVRLVVGKKASGVAAPKYVEAIEEGLCFGWIDSTGRKLDADRFIVRFGPRKRGSTWAISNKARVERLAAAGLMAPAGLAVVEAAKADGTWDLLEDVDALVMPEDLGTALAACPVAADAYVALPAYMRKMILFRVVSAKRPETRARRVDGVVAALADGRDPLA